ncbi:BolA-like protein, partial [Coemansia sp. RSA 2399]
MVLAEELEAKLKNNLAAEAVVRVVDKSGGCGSSFDLFIVSDEFDKVPLLKRHRKIHDMLEDEMPSIHALTM